MSARDADAYRPFVQDGKAAVALQIAVEWQVAESRRRFADTATDRLQDEIRRKRERRGEAANYLRIPRKRGQR